MRRKLIKQGNNAYTITLPIKWVRSNNLEAKSELDMSITNNLITITPETTETKEKAIKINFTKKDYLTNQKFRYINRIYATLYKAGYDEIVFTSDEKDIITYLADRTSNFIGIEILEETKNRLLIKSVVKPQEDEFQNLLIRSFIIIKNLSETLIEKIENKEKDFTSLISLERTNNKITDYLKRILAKTSAKEFQSTRYLYSTVMENERICDEYKYLILALDNNKIKNIETLKKINTSLKALIKITTKYDDKFTKQIAENRTHISELLKDENEKVAHILNNINIQIYEICEAITERHYNSLD